ncbi:Nudix hydrolase 1 [Diplonema papillatum]|nr:Nudix hydrolase 1 [Diplonema papillatum]
MAPGEKEAAQKRQNQNSPQAWASFPPEGGLQRGNMAVTGPTRIVSSGSKRKQPATDVLSSVCKSAHRQASGTVERLAPLVIRPDTSPGGPDLPASPDAYEGVTVFLAGSAASAWRETLTARLQGPMRVVDPFNSGYMELTAEGHERQCLWEQHWLSLPGVAHVFWFPSGEAASCSLFELGSVLSDARGHRLAAGFEPGCSFATDVRVRVGHIAAKYGRAVSFSSSLDELARHVQSWTVAAGEPAADTELQTSPKRAKIRPGFDCPGVGCGGFVFDKDRRVLLIKRAATARSEPGTWARPGGAVELGETAEECLRREMLEEVNLTIDACHLLDVSTQTDPHWVAIGYLCTTSDGSAQAVNMEPHKHEDLRWFSLDALPSPLAAFVADILPRIAADPDKYLAPLENEQKAKAAAATARQH